FVFARAGIAPNSAPVVASKRLIVRSSAQISNCAPSAMKTAASNGADCFEIVLTSLPLGILQSLTALSEPQETSVWPSGLKARERINPLYLNKPFGSIFLASFLDGFDFSFVKSQRLRAPSAPPEAR